MHVLGPPLDSSWQIYSRSAASLSATCAFTNPMWAAARSAASSWIAKRYSCRLSHSKELSGQAATQFGGKAMALYFRESILKSCQHVRAGLVLVTMFASTLTAAKAQQHQQWMPTAKLLSDFFAADFKLQFVVTLRVRPASSDAIYYFLSKDRQFARCVETLVHKRGVTTTTAWSCSELTVPSP